MKRSTLRISLTAALALAVTPLFAAQVMVSASSWGKKQVAAVKNAGGTVVWLHKPTATALVRSTNARLLDKLAASGAFQQAFRNARVNWKIDPPPTRADRSALVSPSRVIANTAVVDPGDDADFWLQWPHDAVNTADAWDAGCTGAGVRVAVIDGGIDRTHEDLAGQVDEACSISFVDGQDPFTDTDPDDFWHGTFVAAVIAAADNDVGGVGIAPGAKVVSVKVNQGGSGGFDEIFEGMLYVADPAAFGKPECARVPIANMSLGIPGGSKSLLQYGLKPGEINQFVALVAKIKNWASTRGVLFVGSAGNDAIDYGQDPFNRVVPNQVGLGVAVSATGPTGWWLGATNYDAFASYYSNYGEDLVWVAAPGGNYDYFFEDPGCVVGPYPCYIFDLWYAAGGPGDSYWWAAGTSFSSPTAAGVAALAKGANPLLSRGDLAVLLKDSATDSGPAGKDQYYGHGFVNAANACALAQASIP